MWRQEGLLGGRGHRQLGAAEAKVFRDQEEEEVTGFVNIPVELESILFKFALLLLLLFTLLTICKYTIQWHEVH